MWIGHGTDPMWTKNKYRTSKFMQLVNCNFTQEATDTGRNAVESPSCSISTQMLNQLSSSYTRLFALPTRWLSLIAPGSSPVRWRLNVKARFQIPTLYWWHSVKSLKNGSTTQCWISWMEVNEQRIIFLVSRITRKNWAMGASKMHNFTQEK